ncbi:efflux RND transporter permease subunit [Acanthopleuribacter pedis]|uniref:MMPL family transporter n=1 Tax=Acanthopleuribacter pedis TaxID=442870 RepID=A0A8J7QGJ8_9BACT|nr:MMPL family transporter [Acanthopleuribacter pedis]MBO1319700.1 MMPL family transporter [Acanthopleuribacter pedis]
MSNDEKTTLSYRTAEFLVKKPILSIAFGVLFIAAFVSGLPYLGSDFSYRMWFRETDPLLQAFDEFERQFGNDENVVIAIHSESGVFDMDTVRLIHQLTEDMWQVKEIIRVDSLSNFNWVHAEDDEMIVEPLIPDLEELELLEPDELDSLLAARYEVARNHETVPGYLLSPDGKMALVIGVLKPAIGGTPDYNEVMSSARMLMRKYSSEPLSENLRDDTFLPKYVGQGDHTFYMSGSSAVSQTFKDVTEADLETMIPILLLAIVAFLLISFRRVSALILPFVIIVPSLMMALGFAGWTGFKFNNLTSTVPHILIAIGIADAVHILVTFFQFRRMGYEKVEATKKTLDKNLLPTLLTSVSTTIGFFSFTTAELVPIIGMGVLAGVGTMFAWIVTIFVLCPLLTMLPIKVKKEENATHISDAHPLAIRYVAWLQKVRIPVIVSFGFLAVFAVYVALQNEINADVFKYFSTNVHTRIANFYIEDQVGGISAIEITIDSGEPDGIKNPAFLKKVERLEDWLDSRYHITKTIAITDIIKQSNRSLNNEDPAAYIIPDNQELVAQELFLYTMSLPQGMDLNNRMTLDNRRMRLSAMTTMHKSAEAVAEFDLIEIKAKEFGLDAMITGKNPLYHRMNGYVVETFIKSILLAVFLVSILMVVILRSVKLGLMSMIPNLMPLVFGGMFMTLLSKPLDIGTVLVASTCLGIAVDDTVHFLTNYLRWRRGGASRQLAVAHVITHTGPALMVTTMILVAGFGTFAFAAFVPNINFGILTAIVLTTAIVTDATLLPALILGKEQEQEEPSDQQVVEAAA